MPASKSELTLPVENPSVLIRSRIQEKRIFEARFLYRQFRAEIGEREKNALASELTGLVAQIEHLQRQARQHAAAGQYECAERLYQDIERLAIDVPGVSEEKRRLQGARTIFAKAPVPIAPEREQAVFQEEPSPPPPPVENLALPPCPPPQTTFDRLSAMLRQWSPRKRLIVAGACGLVLLLLLLRSVQHWQAVQGTTPLQPSPSKQTIVIRPLSASPDGGSDQSAVVSEGHDAADEEKAPSVPSEPPSGEQNVQDTPRRE